MLDVRAFIVIKVMEEVKINHDSCLLVDLYMSLSERQLMLR
jgi:hypothetical protein